MFNKKVEDGKKNKWIFYRKASVSPIISSSDDVNL